MITHTFSQLIIYGAGVTAINAYTFLGYGRVRCFAVSEDGDTDSLYNKEIISYEEMRRLYKQSRNYLIVIAADDYYLEMEENLIRDGISNYIVFHIKDVLGINEYLPFVDIFGKRIWKSYAEVLSHYDFSKYQKIYVYGENDYINYLHIELIIRAQNAEIILVGSKATDKEKNTFLKSVEKNSIVIINVKHNMDDIRDVLNDLDLIESIDLYDIDKFQEVYIHNGLVKYKNIHFGERIFIIGNGPSLTINDLDKIHENKGLSIAFNKIYKIFDKTEWRPTYIGITDPEISRKIELEKMREITVFQGDNIEHWERGRVLKSAMKFHLINCDFYPNKPLFSSNICLGTYRGCSVSYDMGLQFAMYMGCKEIILLGMDHNLEGKVVDEKNHFCVDYFDEEEKKRYSDKKLYYPKDEVTLAFESAKLYASKHGINVYNASRGGKLEVFERIDFDNLF